MSSERRRSPRVAIVGHLHGVAVSVDAPVRVLDLSLGGMAIETAMAMPIGTVQEFQLTLGDGSLVLLKGRVVRSKNSALEGEPAVYLMGVQFVDDEAPAESADVGDLLDKLR